MKGFVIIFSIFFIFGCANVMAPSGGEKDITPPLLINSKLQQNNNELTLSFEFDEYIQLNMWSENFYVSPPVIKPVDKSIKKKNLTISIAEELSQNETYIVSLNNCIKDVNEGNIIDSLTYLFSKKGFIDSLKITGKLQDAYTLKPVKNNWIMLFKDTIADSLIFKITPNYVTKTNDNGLFYFLNLKNESFKIVALSDFDFIYNENEKIAFNNELVNPKQDAFVSLLLFNPIQDPEAESIINPDSMTIKKDTNAFNTKNGSIHVITNVKNTCIFQLLNENNIIQKEFYFTNPPFILSNIPAGKYKLRYVYDINKDKKWTTGNWKNKKQPEKIINYNSEIIIRANWDVEIEWEL